ncbi:MAG: hypothetical protein IT445_09835 [Phycisphaeraceae bacterium]|nr:hypothetical protein [Phycisphaeraceae bacterium]
MTTLARYPDALLRGRMWWVQGGRTLLRLGQLAVMVVMFGLIYGAVMGSFGGLAGERLWQVVFAAMKVPLLLLCTFVLSLPSFFVVNTLLGLRRDFAHAVRALIAAQAGLTIILAALAPLTGFWYVSFTGYEAAIVFNGVMFAIASISAQMILSRLYRPLIESNRRHRLLLRAWLVIYGFVGIQMGWVLRPFIGHPDGPVAFFRQGAWGNGYVELFQKILALFYQ